MSATPEVQHVEDEETQGWTDDPHSEQESIYREITS